MREQVSPFDQNEDREKPETFFNCLEISPREMPLADALDHSLKVAWSV